MFVRWKLLGAIPALFVVAGACAGQSPETAAATQAAAGGAGKKAGHGDEARGGSPISGGKAKTPPIDCGASGKRCSEAPGCPDHCLDALDVCMPETSCQTDETCPSTTPLCALVTAQSVGGCVTEPELDCICANSMAAAAITPCATVQAGTRACIQSGGFCDTVPCCADLKCAKGVDGLARCQPACTNPAGCPSTPVDPKPASCTDVACPSGGPGCCSGHVCAIMGSVRQCKKACSQNEECSTGCCATLGDSELRACLPPEYCGAPFQCGLENESCTGISSCCAGLSCIQTSADAPSTCRPRCTKNTDCATHCCVSSKNTSTSVCLEATFCQ